MVELNVANQAYGACFTPYRARRRRQTFQGGGEVSGGGFIYTSSDRLPMRNAFLTSIWRRGHCLAAATANRLQIDAIQVTEANVSS